jgi:hypothetical protein
MAQTLLARKQQEAIANHLAYTEFLTLLVDDEFARRRDRLFIRRLKSARVPQLKTLESFDWSFNPQIPKALILDLATVRFVPEHGGLLLLGPPGTGKSHIALSLTVAAIQAGYTALYRSAFDLAQDLAESEATGSRPELVRKLTRVDLLVIEDLGMRRLPPTAAGGLAGDLYPPIRIWCDPALIQSPHRRLGAGAGRHRRNRRAPGQIPSSRGHHSAPGSELASSRPPASPRFRHPHRSHTRGTVI